MKKTLLICGLLTSTACFSSEMYKPFETVKQQYDAASVKSCEFVSKQWDVSTDYTAELVTAAGCGGGNHSESWVILRNPNGVVLATKEVGRDFVFVPDLIEFRDGHLNVSGKAFTPDDAHCCPSVTVTREYLPSANDLVQIK